MNFGTKDGGKDGGPVNIYNKVNSLKRLVAEEVSEKLANQDIDK